MIKEYEMGEPDVITSSLEELMSKYLNKYIKVTLVTPVNVVMYIKDIEISEGNMYIIFFGDTFNYTSSYWTFFKDDFENFNLIEFNKVEIISKKEANEIMNNVIKTFEL